MIGYLSQILVRWLGGMKNAAYYQKGLNKQDMNSAITYGIFVIISMGIFGYLTGTLLLQIIPLIAMWYMFKAFEKGDGTFIHLGEYYIIHSFTIISLLFTNCDWIGITVGSLMGDAFFNMPIQKKFTGHYVNSVSGTDSKDGKWLGVYIGKYFIKVPRLSNGYVRLWIGIILSILYITNYIFIGYTFNVSDCIELLKKIF